VIQKAQIGRGFRGVLNYVFKESAELGHDDPRIVGTNMVGETPRALAAEFGLVRVLNPDVSRAVYHCSLRVPEGERVTEERWGQVSRAYLEGMGFADVPYVVVKHAEDHVHIIAARIDFDGRTVSDSNDRWRSNRVVHEVEGRYGLSHAIDPERMHRDRGDGKGRALVGRDEVGLAERTGEIPPKLLLAARIDEAITRSDGTREGFDRVLAGVGVVAHWNIASTGRVSGASFALADYQGAMQPIVKGSQIGKDYSWMRLERRLEERAHGQDGRAGDAGDRRDPAGDAAFGGRGTAARAGVGDTQRGVGGGEPGRAGDRDGAARAGGAAGTRATGAGATGVPGRGADAGDPRSGTAAPGGAGRVAGGESGGAGGGERGAAPGGLPNVQLFLGLKRPASHPDRAEHVPSGG